MSDHLEGQGQGHPRSNIDIIRKMFRIASVIQPYMWYDLQSQGQGHPRSKINFLWKHCGTAQEVLPQMTEDPEHQVQGHPRSNIDILCKLCGSAWGVFPLRSDMVTCHAICQNSIFDRKWLACGHPHSKSTTYNACASPPSLGFRTASPETLGFSLG